MLQSILEFFGIKKKSKKVNLILFGPPGSGKGTQAKKLEDKFGLIQISTGDLFRYELGNNTPLGQKARTYMDKGQLVPDEVTIGMLKNKIVQFPDVNGFIFDGFPRTIPQANALKNLLLTMGQSVTALIALDVDNEELVTRLLDRGKLSGRADDANESVIRNRLDVYNEETAPVYTFYNEINLAQTIPGKGSIEEINSRLNNLISTFF
ncbi:MAG: adenylate kinase [Saprospiraceae bacterium]|nr:adenylate kinase [Saprospiraceae bacterium]|tara:strand:+ start:544 stop:1167 length:624 start_codon:yes stop_codon:yes gene_type:complete